MEYRCDLCGETVYREKKGYTKSLGINDNKFKIVSCSNCNLYCLNPIPNNKEFKEIYKNYSLSGNRLNVEKYRIKNIYPQKLSLIKEFYKTAKSILDIGAGNGGFASVAIDSGYDVIGIEPEIEQCYLAKRNFGIKLLNIKFEEYIKKSKMKFDVVHLYHVFEHVQKPSKILFDIKKVIKPNGIVIVEVPNQFFQFPQRFYSYLQLKSYKKPYNPYHHLYFYSKKTLIKYAINAGYDILYFNDKVDDKGSYKRKLKNIIASILKLSTSNVLEIVLIPK